MAGGVKDVEIGDVVVATKVYGYEVGKDDGELKPRPELQHCAHALEQRGRAVRLNSHWQTRLDGHFNHANPRIFVGPIAAGEKVVASTHGLTAKLLRECCGDTLAVEMEGRGFLEGVHINAAQGCVIRGISDLLDQKTESDRIGSQARAADAAVAVALEILSAHKSSVVTSPTSTPTAGQSALQLLVGTGARFESVEVSGVNLTKTIRVKVQNNTDAVITDCRLEIKNIDPAPRWGAGCLLKDGIDVPAGGHRFAGVAAYNVGTSEANPGSWIQLLSPMGGGFFAESLTILPVETHKLHLRISSLSCFFKIWPSMSRSPPISLRRSSNVPTVCRSLSKS